MQSWIKNELKTIDLGDKRIDQRACGILAAFAKHPQATIPQAFDSSHEMKACYRFLSNGIVSQDKLLEPHHQATLERIKQHPVVLLVSDSSSLDYSKKHKIQGLGRIRTEYSKGLWIHPTVAITPERLNMGLVDLYSWTRDIKIAASPSKEISRKKVTEKESWKWIRSYEKASEAAGQCPNTHIISVMDREADLAELFAELEEQKSKNQGADIIVRASYNRVLHKDESSSKLREKLKRTSPLGQVQFCLPAKGRYPSRLVTQQVRSVQAHFRDKRVGFEKIRGATLTAVMLTEENPPEGVAGLEWVLLTSLSVTSLEEATKIVEYYLCRWEIEIYFKTLKSGCRVEDSHLQTLDALKNLLGLYCLVAWRVMYAMMLGRKYPELPCTAIFSESECSAALGVSRREEFLPEAPISLGEFVIIVAKFGGYPARKNDPPPGIKVIWVGLSKLTNYTEAWEIFHGRGIKNL